MDICGFLNASTKLTETNLTEAGSAWGSQSGDTVHPQLCGSNCGDKNDVHS